MKLLQQAARSAETRVSSRAKFTAVLAALGLFLPTFAFASEGDHVNLQFDGTGKALLGAVLLLSIGALIAAFALGRWVMAQSDGSAEMREVAQAIKDGAVAYLRQQVGTMIGFVLLLAVGLVGLYWANGIGPAVLVAVSFIFGVAGSYAAGSTGMIIAVNGNVRTAHAALSSYKKSLETAFRSGAVAGLMTVGIGLFGATIILFFGGSHATQYLIGFGFGGSLAALFMRVGGGIFTKAADVGADLVGKVEAGIPEDDPRNPAVIADNVGDNVGDCAGMAADVFESYEVTLVSAIVLAAATASILDQATWTKLVLFAMLVSGIGILASIFGILSVKGNDSLDSDPLAAIRSGFLRSAGISAVLIGIAAFLFMGGKTPLATSKVSSLDEAFKADAQVILRVRDQLVKSKPAPGAVASAQQEIAKQFNRLAPDVKADDIFANPAKIPASLLGVPKIAVEREINKDASPVTVDDITPEDVLNTKELKDLGFNPEDRATVQKAFTPSTTPSKPTAGLVAVTNFKDTSIKTLDFATQVPQTSPVPASPDSPYVSLRDFFGGTGKDAVVFAKVHIKAHVPARPGQNGAPATVEQDIDRNLWQGPAKQSAIDEIIKRTSDAAKSQNINATIEVSKSVPAILYVNEETGDVAVGISPEVERPYALDSQRNTITYYRKSAKDLNAETAKANKSANRPPTPTAVPIPLVAVSSKTIPWWGFMLATWVGLALAFVIERLTEYYVSTHKKPTQEVAGVSSGGAAPMIIQGFAYGLESSAMMVLVIVFALMMPLFLFPASVYGGYTLALYGVALVGLGLLSTTGFVLAMDTFGPISDNAQGVFEMSGAGHDNPQGAKAVGHLDAAGNTTKALTKGFAIATAVVAAVALFNSYRGEAMLTDIGLKLDVPEIFLGLLIGGAAPFLFSAFAINAVGRSAFQLINEVRRQFRENPGIMEGTVRPDYARCVAMVTAAAQKELLAPGILAIALPAAVAFGFSIGKPTTTINGLEYNLTGAQALGGFLAGAILSGQLMAVLLSNSGGMWDNAKKLIEDGLYGGKGSEAHKASVICDTVGDPFKDTAGPALNPLIKVMNLVALLLAGTIVRPLSNPVLIGITLVCVGLLVFSVYMSKKGSLSEDLQNAQAEGAKGDAHFSHPTLPSDSTPEASTEAPKKRRITVEDDTE
jgi:K(+)-stimulated pyrophosphate-energized sodium pump